MSADFEPLPFDEAVDFFRDKLNLSPGQFAELEEAARLKAFTIAGGATAQARAQIMDLIDRAMTEGVGLREFQQRANEIMDRAGLSERTPWYWQTVYRTNLQQSYQVGRYKQMTDPYVRERRPYWRYVSALLPTSRPSHVEKHGTVLPTDDPFWDEWYPPNGFNCYCKVQSVSENLLERRGWEISAKDFAFPDADEGFQTNPGALEAV